MTKKRRNAWRVALAEVVAGIISAELRQKGLEIDDDATQVMLDRIVDLLNEIAEGTTTIDPPKGFRG